MNPLYEKYFFGELTDTEEQTLEQMLTDSESSAWEFGQAAEEIYKRYGLPEPAVPENPSDGDGSKPWAWLFPILALLMLAGYLGWKTLQPKPELAPQPLVPSLPKPMKKVVVKIVKPLQKAVKVLAPIHPIGSPPPGWTPEREAGNNLKVVVHRETAGPVVVRVVNSLGMEIRRMYSGTVQAGRWSFEWDGRSEDGRLVEPGQYYIQVQTEGTTQSREVNIR